MLMKLSYPKGTVEWSHVAVHSCWMHESWGRGGSSWGLETVLDPACLSVITRSFLHMLLHRYLETYYKCLREKTSGGIHVSLPGRMHHDDTNWFNSLRCRTQLPSGPLHLGETAVDYCRCFFLPTHVWMTSLTWEDAAFVCWLNATPGTTAGEVCVRGVGRVLCHAPAKFGFRDTEGRK